MRIMRVRGRRLQAPVVRYEHCNQDRTVTLIGVAHLAEPSYYMRVQELVDSLEMAGAVVCYEMIDSAPAAEWAAAEKAEQEAYEALRRDASSPVGAIASYFGWSYQLDMLAYSQKWIRTDLTDLELIRALTPEKILRSADAEDLPRTGNEHALTGPAAAMFFRFISLIPIRLLMRSADKDKDRIIVEQRNDIALKALPETGDAVLIWGSDHLRGIGMGLRAAGFRRRSTRWLTVGALPPAWRSFGRLFSRTGKSPAKVFRGPSWPQEPAPPSLDGPRRLRDHLRHGR